MLLRLSKVVETVIAPALAVLPRVMRSDRALVLLLATGLQESRFEFRRQLGGGPGRGFWQFELGTRESRSGVWGVYLHRASAEDLRLLCRERDCAYEPTSIWERLEHDDVLAAGAARLLYWTNSAPLPEPGQREEAWKYYMRTWRPGRPRARSWPGYYQAAMREVFPGGA